MRESGGTGSLVSTSNIPPQMSKVVARKPTGAVGPSTSYAPERPRTRRGLWVVDRTPRRGRRGTTRGARREPSCSLRWKSLCTLSSILVHPTVTYGLALCLVLVHRITGHQASIHEVVFTPLSWRVFWPFPASSPLKRSLPDVNLPL